MLRNFYLAAIAVVALGAAVLLPRLVDGHPSSVFTTLVGDVGGTEIDRLEVGSR